MSEYKFGNWYCKPANEAEAHEIVERAVASGAVAGEVIWSSENPNGYSWSCYGCWGVLDGQTFTGDRVFKHSTEYTIAELRQLMPLPGERPVETLVVVGDKYEVRNQHGYILSDLGEKFMGNNVTVRSIFTNSRGYVMAAVEKDGGDCCCFRSDMLYPLRTEREKWVDAVMFELQDWPDTFIPDRGPIRQIFDAIQSGVLKAPEAE